MKNLPAPAHPSFYGKITHFLRWYWFMRPAKIIALYARYATAFGEAFSIIYLLKTFIAPWKSIQDAYPTKGLNVSALLETLTLNMTARIIGMIVRTGAMLAGLVLQLFLFFCFVAYLCLWLLFPLFLLGGIIVLTTYYQ